MSQFAREQETYILPVTGAEFLPLWHGNTVSGPMCASGLLMRCSSLCVGGNCTSGLVVKQDLTSFYEILGVTKYIYWWVWKRPLEESRLTTVFHQGCSFGTSVRNACTLKAGWLVYFVKDGNYRKGDINLSSHLVLITMDAAVPAPEHCIGQAPHRWSWHAAQFLYMGRLASLMLLHIFLVFFQLKKAISLEPVQYWTF